MPDKTLRVVAALILEEDKVLATQRNYGEFEGGWEFPGGKIEQGETPEEALARELEEELEIELGDVAFFSKAEYDYPTFHLDMDCFTCTVASGSIKLHDHSQMRWLDADHVMDIDWLPADLPIAEKLRTLLRCE